MTELDEDTRLKLIGLRAVGQDLWQQIQAVEKAAARLVGEPDEVTGHASDFIAAADGSRSTPERLWMQASRERWRQLLLCIKAKLESIEQGIELFDDAFLSQIVMPDGQTIGEKVKPQMTALMEGKPLRPLMIEGPAA